MTASAQREAFARVTGPASVVGWVSALIAPATVRGAGGPAPNESCVPGTVWEDLASGVKYICIYDELYGGPRWELLSGGQRGASAWLYRSSTYGCASGQVGLTSLGGSGAGQAGMGIVRERL